MKTEIEVKFCQIDIEGMRRRLQEAGAVCEQPMRLMRRTVFHTTDHNQQAYLRVRDEGNKTTLTYKQFVGEGIHDAREAETSVGDYETTIEVLKQVGLEVKSVQETRRETWKLDHVEIVIDEWPWLEPFIEIEGESEVAVRAVSERLGFDWKNAVIGPVTMAYRQSYPDLPSNMVLDDVAEIRFDLPAPRRLYGEI